MRLAFIATRVHCWLIFHLTTGCLQIRPAALLLSQSVPTPAFVAWGYSSPVAGLWKRNIFLLLNKKASLFLSSLMSTKYTTSMHPETQPAINQFWSLRPTFVFFFASFCFLVLLIPWGKKKSSLVLLPFSKLSLSWKPGTKWKPQLQCWYAASFQPGGKIFFHSPQGKAEIHKELTLFILLQNCL